MLMATAGMPPVVTALLHNASTIGILGYAAMAASRPLDIKESAKEAVAVPSKEKLC